jgi:hypothetical protein
VWPVASRFGLHAMTYAPSRKTSEAGDHDA